MRGLIDAQRVGDRSCPVSVTSRSSGSLLMSGCGAGKTVTSVQTVTAPGGTTAPSSRTVESGTTAPGGSTGASGTTTAAAERPLPGGRAAVEGRYAMRVRGAAFSRINQDVAKGEQSTWPISIACAGEACRLMVRRELKSGAFESLTLKALGDAAYAASSTGTTTACTFGPDEAATIQRLSVRVTATNAVNGRPTAQRIDAYMTVRAKCKSGPASGRARATISWRGTRLP